MINSLQNYDTKISNKLFWGGDLLGSALENFWGEAGYGGGKLIFLIEFRGEGFGVVGALPPLFPPPMSLRL